MGMTKLCATFRVDRFWIWQKPTIRACEGWFLHPDGAFFAVFFGNGNTEKGFFSWREKRAFCPWREKKRRHGLRGERKSGCTAEKTAGTWKDGNGETRREKAIQHNVMLPFTSEKQNITRKPLCLPHNILNGKKLRRYCCRKEAEQRWMRFSWFEGTRMIGLYYRRNTENQRQKEAAWVLVAKCKIILLWLSLEEYWKSMEFLVEAKYFSTIMDKFSILPH